jgi:hypothetical protein
MNRSLLVSLASVTLALFVGGCAADFDAQEPGNEQDTNASLEEGTAAGRFNSERASQKVEGVANIQDPRTQAGEDLAQRAAGHEPLLVKMHDGNDGLVDTRTTVDGH